jgi:DNA invertase Pin-like site-specific DNA recombinase
VPTKTGGKRGDRDQFQKMFAAASRHEFDCLLFWSLDRLSREGTVETLNHLQRLTGYGVNYRSFTEQYLDSTGMFKEAVIEILAAVAKQKRVRLSERSIAGLQRARAQGRIGGRPRTEHDPRTMAKLAALRRSGASIRRIARGIRFESHDGCPTGTRAGDTGSLTRRATYNPVSRKFGAEYSALPRVKDKQNDPRN